MKKFAEIVTIQQEPQQVGDYLYKFTENWICDAREKWDSFMLDSLYDLYKRMGFTKVFMISKEDFKKFLIWALPVFQAEIELNKDELINEIRYKLIGREKCNLKDIDNICENVLPLINNFSLKRFKEIL